MLILTRYIGQSLMTGDDIVVKVLGFDRNQIRIGIDARKYIPVHRKEIYNRIKEQEAG